MLQRRLRTQRQRRSCGGPVFTTPLFTTLAVYAANLLQFSSTLCPAIYHPVPRFLPPCAPLSTTLCPAIYHPVPRYLSLCPAFYRAMPRFLQPQAEAEFAISSVLSDTRVTLYPPPP